MKFLALLFFFGTFTVHAQFSNFVSLEPNPINDSLILPSTHQFQYLVREGDSIDGNLLFGWPDYTAYFPLNGSSADGILCLNHELNNANARVSMMPISLDTGYWSVNGHSYLDFSDLHGTSRPCSGGITSWGTVVIGEEDTTVNDLDANGYHDIGWLVEFDPVAGEIVDYDNNNRPDKVWKCGKMLHENVCFFNDSIAFFGADDGNWGFLYKFVCDQPQDLSSGTLYVLVADSVNGNTANWFQVANGTPADCNRVQHFALDHNATNFEGIEDCEIGLDGKVYFTSKFTGRVYRLTGNNSTVNDLEVYVENQVYSVQHSTGTSSVSWGTGHDNLVFDDDDNLYVCQDGGQYYIWLVRNDHSMSNPKIDIFARTPAGGEPTGITFTPDYKYMFLSFMHPFANNSDTIADMFGTEHVMNRGTSIVISRVEDEPVRVNEIPNQGVAVWYSNGKIFTESDARFVSYKIYDISGKLIESGNWRDVINISTAYKGAVVVRLSNQKTSVERKLLID